jgi:hypothetical protein
MKTINNVWYFENPLTSFLDSDGCVREVPSFPGRTVTASPLTCNQPIPASVNLDREFSLPSSQSPQSQICLLEATPVAPIPDATDHTPYTQCTSASVRESHSSANSTVSSPVPLKHSTRPSFLRFLWQYLDDDAEARTPQYRKETFERVSRILRTPFPSVPLPSEPYPLERYALFSAFGWSLLVSVECRRAKPKLSHSSQFTNSSNSHTRSVTPAAIAGVTLRLECTRKKL